MRCACVHGSNLSTTVLWHQFQSAYFLVIVFVMCLCTWICPVYNCAVASVSISQLSSNAFEQVFPQIRGATLHTFDLLFIISSSVKVVSSLCQLSQAVCWLIDNNTTSPRLRSCGRTLNDYRHIPCNTPGLEVI